MQGLLTCALLSLALWLFLALCVLPWAVQTLAPLLHLRTLP